MEQLVGWLSDVHLDYIIFIFRRGIPAWLIPFGLLSILRLLSSDWRWDHSRIKKKSNDAMKNISISKIHFYAVGEIAIIWIIHSPKFDFNRPIFTQHIMFYNS